MTFVRELRCRACGHAVEKVAITACPACGDQLDPDYDWDAIAGVVDRDRLRERPHTIWRYHELLPLDHAPTVSGTVGWSPLVRAPRLAEALGVARAWVKCDGALFPSLSFKDRVVAVAVNKALELGLDTVACPSTGNLANAVAAHAAAAGLRAWIFVPDTIEVAKTIGTAVYGPRLVRVRGTYDEINALCRGAAAEFGWGVVNVNLRAYYGEGSKTMAFEIAEQLGWRAPMTVVAPMAGGSLVPKLAKGFAELARLGWTDGPIPRVHGAQAAGCAPIATAVREGVDEVTPVRPDTVVRSLAIGNPVDGRWAVRAIRESGGWAAAVPDADVLRGMRLLAETAGVFGETAAGVTVAAAEALVREGRIEPTEEVVLCITGNGMKTVEALRDAVPPAPVIEPTLHALKDLL